MIIKNLLTILRFVQVQLFLKEASLKELNSQILRFVKITILSVKF